MKLEKFLKELESKKPYPGGGSAAALTALVSTSLIIMVANISGLKDIKKETKKVNKRLEKLIDKDAKAYKKVVAAYKSKDEKKISKALKYAIEVPMKIAEESYATMELAEKAYEKGRKSTSTDIYTAVVLARSAIEASLKIVELNLYDLKDCEYEKEIIPKKNDLLNKSAYKRMKIHAKVKPY